MREHVEAHLRGLLAPGGKGELRLPSERALATALGVSRITARGAYQALMNEGLVTPAPRGYVARRAKHEAVLTLDGFTRGIGPGQKIETRTLAAAIVAPEREVMEALNLGLEEQVVRLRRLRLLDGRPYQVEDCHLSARHFSDLLASPSLPSLYQYLLENHGIKVLRAEQVLAVLPASAEIGGLLDLGPGANILFLRRTSYDQRNSPVEYVRIHLNPAGREFYMELKR